MASKLIKKKWGLSAGFSGCPHLILKYWWEPFLLYLTDQNTNSFLEPNSRLLKESIAVSGAQALEEIKEALARVLRPNKANIGSVISFPN